MRFHSYVTEGGIRIRRAILPYRYEAGTTALAERLDTQRGVLLSSSVEFRGRYSRWDIGFADPPLVLTGRGRDFTVEALNVRGRILLAPIATALDGEPAIASLRGDGDRLIGRVRASDDNFPEEQRSRQPSLFSILRTLTRLFASPDDRHLGLYGAFGYDLVFQFEPMALRLKRAADQRDLLLYLPDEILVVDQMKQEASLRRYEFETVTGSTEGLPRDTLPAPYQPVSVADLPESDHGPGDYPAQVERARAAFARGDLFEVVLGQLFTTACIDPPSTVFARLSRSNPAPYGALMNLGEGEFLVAASPEMFVRVEGKRIETCPISGTIARGRDAIEDAERIRTLLNSAKDEAELTMCTDVDRNDKSRVCAPASVRVIGRRQIELYSRLIHTVDHVEGRLRPEFDALDGFLSHAWAVTVTGAPKPWAIRFIEQNERSARRWYGGAIGRTGFDGDMNTGLTLRTVRMKSGVAEVRAGATLLHDSDPAAEDAECRLKASAMLSAIRGEAKPQEKSAPRPKQGRRVLLIDHEDSFVHTLAGYLRQAGATVETLRPALARAALRAGMAPDLVVLSPGPGRPADFAMAETLALLTRQARPVFGVCLGLQGIVEYFGGSLDQLARPVHGKALDRAAPGRQVAFRFAGQLHGRALPLALRRSHHAAAGPACDGGERGRNDHGDRTRDPAIAAVQFHPESIMTPYGAIGLPIVEAALSRLA